MTRRFYLFFILLWLRPRIDALSVQNSDLKLNKIMWIFNNTGSNFTTRNNKLLQGWLLCILFSKDYTVLMFFRELCYIIGSKNLMRACLETTAAWIRQDSLRSQLIWVEQTTHTQMHRKTWLHVCIWDSNANTWNHWTTFFLVAHFEHLS